MPKHRRKPKPMMIDRIGPDLKQKCRDLLDVERAFAAAECPFLLMKFYSTRIPFEFMSAQAWMERERRPKTGTTASLYKIPDSL
jgi:hypothetical protein